MAWNKHQGYLIVCGDGISLQAIGAHARPCRGGSTMPRYLGLPAALAVCLLCSLSPQSRQLHTTFPPWSQLLPALVYRSVPFTWAPVHLCSSRLHGRGLEIHPQTCVWSVSARGRGYQLPRYWHPEQTAHLRVCHVALWCACVCSFHE